MPTDLATNTGYETVVVCRANTRFTFSRVILATSILATGLETSAALIAEYGSLLRSLEDAVLVILIVEVSLKLASHGRHPLNIFWDGWNVFDFVIVACCLVGDLELQLKSLQENVQRLRREREQPKE